MEDINDAIVYLELSNSPEICLVNFSDYEKVKNYQWRFDGKQVISNIKHIRISLARFLYGYNTDHIDRNPLNNLNLNFRKASFSQQQANRCKPRVGKSKFKNIYFRKSRNKFEVVVQFKHKKYYGGSYLHEIDAALMANRLMTELHGNFAVLNNVC